MPRSEYEAYVRRTKDRSWRPVKITKGIKILDYDKVIPIKSEATKSHKR